MNLEHGSNVEQMPKIEQALDVSGKWLSDLSESDQELVESLRINEPLFDGALKDIIIDSLKNGTVDSMETIH